MCVSAILRVVERSRPLLGCLGVSRGVFQSCFDSFWLCFGMIVHVFFMFFFSFLDRSLNSANPKIIEMSSALLGYFALGTFSRRSIFGPISDEFRYYFHIGFLLMFMTFSASNLALFFSLIFHEKWPRK